MKNEIKGESLKRFVELYEMLAPVFQLADDYGHKIKLWHINETSRAVIEIKKIPERELKMYDAFMILPMVVSVTLQKLGGSVEMRLECKNAKKT